MASSLSIGIVGLPNVGKSTLFNALLKRQAALAANYPFATIEPNIGVVDVPDARLNRLAEIVKADYGQRIGDREIPEKIIPSVVKFYDIAGLVKGAASGEGLGNEFLTHIRDVDAIVHVVRDFDDDNIVRAGSTTPAADIEIINTELILADLQVLEKRLEKMGKEVRSDKTTEEYKKYELFIKIKEALGSGLPAMLMTFNDKEKELLKDSSLLTLKPMIFVFNTSEDRVSGQKAINRADIDNIPQKVFGGSPNANTTPIYISAKIESEIAAIGSEQERNEFMTELGLDCSGLDKVIKKGFEILGLESFLTMGPKEVRSWTIKRDTKAPQAAGVIHTDFERGFISADIISYSDLDRVGSLKTAKDRGLIRLEGKSYTMQDGDVTEFHFSV